eukprot:134687-Rhodomonas_salina.1
MISHSLSSSRLLHPLSLGAAAPSFAHTAYHGSFFAAPRNMIGDTLPWVPSPKIGLRMCCPMSTTDTGDAPEFFPDAKASKESEPDENEREERASVCAATGLILPTVECDRCDDPAGKVPLRAPRAMSVVSMPTSTVQFRPGRRYEAKVQEAVLVLVQYYPKLQSPDASRCYLCGVRP